MAGCSRLGLAIVFIHLSVTMTTPYLTNLEGKVADCESSVLVCARGRLVHNVQGDELQLHESNPVYPRVFYEYF